MSKFFALWTSLILGALFLSGCSSEPSEETVKDDVLVMPAMPNTTVDVQPVSAQNLSQPRIVMSKGQQHYFHKVIEQSLSGDSLNSVTEKIELLLSMTVVEVTPKSYELEVSFHNIRYHNTIGDQQLVYDSRSSADVPPEVLPYQGLLENGFNLVINRNNTIQKINGYPQFLEKCVSQYPAGLRQGILQQLGGGVTNNQEVISMAMSFLDESIALLPFGPLSSEGDSFPVDATWPTTFSRSQPVPVEESIQSRIQHVSGDGQTVHVTIQGELRPLNPQGSVTANAVRTRILGGEISGSCSVSLKTGLPKSCRIQRDVTLEIASLRQPPVTARKTVITSLEAWTPQEPR